METRRRTGECDRRVRREAVEPKHLDLAVHLGPGDRGPYVLEETVMRGRRVSKRSRMLTGPEILTRWMDWLSSDPRAPLPASITGPP